MIELQSYALPSKRHDFMADRTQRLYSKGEIDRTGMALIPWWTGRAEEPQNLGVMSNIIQNWRNCHAFPLNTFQVVLKSRAKRIEDDVIVAQRLKRLPSIMNKLSREPEMKLSQMQDLGGCRAILSSVRAVEQLSEIYVGTGVLFEGAKPHCKDYLKNPKDDGYRGIHIVGRYRARTQNNEAWNGQRIEIQIRTRLQHAFSTAVETVTTFTRAPLKFGGGPEEWRRFFSLMGSALALREGTPLVSGTPSSEAELIKELREAARELKVRPRLRGWARALRKLRRKNITGFKWLLLVLNVSTNTLEVTGYSDAKEAMKEVARLEQLGNSDLDPVLVWTNSAKNLKQAYPNYYADTGEFLSALNVALS